MKRASILGAMLVAAIYVLAAPKDKPQSSLRAENTENAPVTETTEQLISSNVLDSTLARVDTARVAVDKSVSANAGIDSIYTYTTYYNVQVADSFLHVETTTGTRQVEQEPERVDSTRRGHHLQVLLGGGYGSMNYHLPNGSVMGHGAAALQIQYAYFWHPEWGVSAGLGVSSYGSRGVNDWQREWSDQTDTDGEAYTHRIDVRRLTERQHTWMLDIPIEIQCMHPFNNKVGLMAGLGFNLGIPVSTQYRLQSGEVEHKGWYEPWHMEIQDYHDFYTETVGRELSDRRQNSKMLLPQAALMAHLGFYFPVSERVDLLLAAYARYTLNNVQPAGVEEAAFMHTEYMGAEAYKNHTFMQREYAGMLGTTQAEKIHPWQAGLQFGVQWHAGYKHIPAVMGTEPFAVYDTLYITRMREEEHLSLRRDTILEPVYELKQLMNKSIIWFDLNSYVPKLDPVDILEQMAAVLIANPGLRVEVNGHTCTIGKRAYNQKLSEKRAQAVADRLIALGVNPDQLECHGYCSDKPYFSESHQLFLDRRCEIIPIEETNTKKVRKN